ncbi:transposase [Flavobacterium sp.]|uniref:transposase n=1 Tax=Flavobacterium sp. TaxID=239 RepID=UPI0032658B37
MKKEDLLSDEFLKQFKTGEDLNGFLAQLQKRGIEAILSGELDSHLGYEKHEKTISSNARNGFSNKKIKTSFGESEIQVPYTFPYNPLYRCLS